MVYQRMIGAIICILLLLTVLVPSGTDNKAVAGRQFSQTNLVDIPVLNYHKVDGLYSALSLSPEEFDRQMTYLYENGYHTITPDQLLAYIKSGASLPENPVLITFDDGYLDNYTNAYKILKHYNFTATIFLVTGKIGNDPRFMNWDQVREMKQDGFVFGSHTDTHQALTEISPEAAFAELVRSSETIKKELGSRPRYFAYPTGAYNLQIASMVKQAGYRAAFTVKYGQAGPESYAYAIERIPMFKSGNTFRSFYYRLNGAAVAERLGMIKN